MWLIVLAYGVMLWICMVQMGEYRRCTWACREAAEWFWLGVGCMACFFITLLSLAGLGA